MKNVFVIMISGMLLLFNSSTSFSQSLIAKFQTSIIEPYPLQITTNKTTNLIFPYAIKSVDRGSADILAQKAKGVQNILLVKAGRENFHETNLSVITEDGKLYSFIIDYINSPAAINISFVADSVNAKESESLKSLYDRAAIQLDAERILKEKKKIHGIRDYRYEVKFALQGVYIKNDVIFLKIEVLNNSNINYDVEMLRFFITDEKKAKRTAMQEIEIKPLYTNGNMSVVKAESSILLVVALPKFTIPDQKYLSVQLMENNGGRNLKLTVRNRTIIKAKKF